MPKSIISSKTYLVAKEELKKLKNEGTLFKKLQSVKLAYEHGIKNTADFLGVFPVSIRNWGKLINDGKLDELRIGSKHNDGTKLKHSHRIEIKKWLAEDPNLSIMSVKEKLEQNFNLIVSKSTTHRAMKSVGFSYITPRKNHYKQDENESVKFKKN